MNKEEFLKAIENVSKTDSINPISAYNSINVEDLASAIDRFKKVPTYDELLKENKKYKEVIDKAIEYMKDFIFEPLLTNEDRKLIMYNDNLRNFEKILKEVE